MIEPLPLALAFGEGLALVFSPCILPILPLLLGASLDGSRARPLGIVTGFILAFTVFAVISRQAVLAFGLDAAIIRDASLVMLMLLGVVMLFPRLSDAWSAKFQSLGGKGDRLIDRIRGTGFRGGVGIGALIGIVWTPCAGPILAAAIVQIVQAQSHAQAAATIAVFAAGAGLPMLSIALFGRGLAARLGFLKKHGHTLRRALGVLMIGAAIAIYAGLDLKLVAWQAQMESARRDVPQLAEKLDAPYPAPELAGITGWINTDPLTLQSLRGKVVLVDFWTYSCINCIRTFPHLKKWYDTYKDQGFVIIGVHAPEFAFEKKIDNVREAMLDYGISWPVALDNDFATWRAYQNKYWPAHYLIDRDGNVVYTHFGEGLYEQTENNIRSLLGVKGTARTAPVAIKTDDQTHETYLGYARAQNLANAGGLRRDMMEIYAAPAVIPMHNWALDGAWRASAQNLTSGDGGTLRLRFTAGKVYLVLGSEDGNPVDIDITLDGKVLKTITVQDETLYTLYEAGLMGETTGLMELKPRRAGLQAYAFTFGK